MIRYWGPKTDLGVAKSRLAHLEIVYSDDPWQRCGEMMHQFDISVCVADALPNSNEAVRFAKDFPGRVFLCEYNYTPESGTDDICEWGDKPKESVKERKAADDTKNKFTVRANRYLAIEWNLKKYVERLKEQPHEKGLVMEVQEGRGYAHQRRLEFICQNLFWSHLQKVARIKEEDEETGQIKMNFVNLGDDPHFLHADLYAELALSRVSQEGTSRAFGSFAAAQAAKPGEHAFVQLVGTNHWECTRCELKVRVLDGMTPEEVAAKLGRSECRPI